MNYILFLYYSHHKVTPYPPPPNCRRCIENCSHWQYIVYFCKSSNWKKSKNEEKINYTRINKFFTVKSNSEIKQSDLERTTIKKLIFIMYLKFLLNFLESIKSLFLINKRQFVLMIICSKSQKWEREREIVYCQINNITFNGGTSSFNKSFYLDNLECPIWLAWAFFDYHIRKMKIPSSYIAWYKHQNIKNGNV